ncbi:alkanesulfonate monooxygenase SsuD/methylene tetrahydromethanopterin reductase-like flavin-dependent oxidoreductase (luciferase family) [Georgenia soli]|uniref:Alkanesulfonate monooxygenase SsuD/methylene tetrahydromethanopterin reductase-like flavin-dependent oxidoreductase (Luciferase family) n=1 Tax=Georgenia soli TaxID=638953 RepID=A0A2A9EQY4_9MICO|nr:LLM class flavin-dependent oxidoreductase [Georgenia soli]PFG40619.1 alkanesulfonate monooxygenase SsuD/methylene tetrahydromethanopterin reductase-like flavin-dependent oxidoreductase (luciferase family) [Georgenia soli]
MSPTGRARTGVMLPRDLETSSVLEYAVRAEELGFDELWVVEDLGFRGGVAQAAALLGATRTIRVGIGILPAGARNAAFAAMEAATLAQLFPGRVDVGVGHGMPGWMRAVGAWPPRPLRHLEEHVTAVRDLLHGRAAALGGPEDRGATGVALEPSAVPAVVPDLLLGVRGPRSLALSGRVADGTILAEPCTPEYVAAARRQIAATRPHRLVAYNVASVGPDPRQALAAARPALRWIGEPDWAPHLAPLDLAEELAQLRARSAGPEDFARALPDEWVARLALAGTPRQVRARMDDLAGAGVTSNVLVPVAADPLAALEALSDVL